jgi:hypothetical protein
MITYKQIVKAITDKLVGKFPLIPIVENNVEEGFDRPSFFVMLDNVTRDERRHYSIRSMTCRIYFFPSDRYNFTLEFLDIQEKLESAFNLTLSVADRLITITETRTQQIGEQTETKVLEFEFDFSFHDDPYTTEEITDLMGELNYNG